MKPEGFMGKVYQGLDLFMKIAYVNLLWILFTVIGLVIFGVVPASVALLSVIRKWLMKDTDIAIFSTFFRVYKKEFIRSNIAGFFFMLIFIILYIHFSYSLLVGGLLQVILTIGFVINGMLALVTLIYFFPVYVHYDLTLVDYFKRSFLVGMINIHFILMILICLVVIYSFFIFSPGYVGLFLPILVGIPIMAVTLISFNKIDRRKIEEIKFN